MRKTKLDCEIVYDAHRKEVKAIMARIEKKLRIMDERASGSTSWGHAGSMERVKEQLTDLESFFG